MLQHKDRVKNKINTHREGARIEDRQWPGHHFFSDPALVLTLFLLHPWCRYCKSQVLSTGANAADSVERKGQTKIEKRVICYLAIAD